MVAGLAEYAGGFFLDIVTAHQQVWRSGKFCKGRKKQVRGVRSAYSSKEEMPEAADE